VANGSRQARLLDPYGKKLSEKKVKALTNKRLCLLSTMVKHQKRNESTTIDSAKIHD